MNAYSPEMLEKYYRMRGARGAEKRREKKGEGERKSGIKKGEGLPEQLIGRLTGENVEIHMLRGGVYRGRLKEVGKYEVILETEGGGEVLIYKHAISTVVKAKPLPF